MAKTDKTGIVDSVEPVLNDEVPEGVKPEDIDQSFQEDCKGPDATVWDDQTKRQEDEFVNGDGEWGTQLVPDGMGGEVAIDILLSGTPKGPDPEQWG